MTLHNFPPADQCSPEDLDNLVDLVVSDPRASYDLTGSREHIEALCRRYQRLEQHLVEMTEERDDLKARCQSIEESRTRIGDLASECIDDLAAARKAIADREDEIAACNNARQAEVNDAAEQRERADSAQAASEIFETTARAALALVSRPGAVDLAELVAAVDGRLSRALVREQAISAALGAKLEDAMRQLEEQQETRALDDQLRSTCRTITGKDLGEVNIQLDAELAAHPEPGPLHHARDMREPEHHPFVIGKFKRGDRGGQWPEETCDVCGTDPRNAIHQEDSTP